MVLRHCHLSSFLQTNNAENPSAIQFWMKYLHITAFSTLLYFYIIDFSPFSRTSSKYHSTVFWESKWISLCSAFKHYFLSSQYDPTHFLFVNSDGPTLCEGVRIQEGSANASVTPASLCWHFIFPTLSRCLSQKANNPKIRLADWYFHGHS